MEENTRASTGIVRSTTYAAIAIVITTIAIVMVPCIAGISPESVNFNISTVFGAAKRTVTNATTILNISNISFSVLINSRFYVLL